MCSCHIVVDFSFVRSMTMACSCFYCGEYDQELRLSTPRQACYSNATATSSLSASINMSPGSSH